MQMDTDTAADHHAAREAGLSAFTLAPGGWDHHYDRHPAVEAHAALTGLSLDEAEAYLTALAVDAEYDEWEMARRLED